MLKIHLKRVRPLNNKNGMCERTRLTVEMLSLYPFLSAHLQVRRILLNIRH